MSYCVRPTLDANIRAGAEAVGVSIELVPRALDDMIFLPWRFNSYLHIAEEMEVVYALVVVLGFQVYKIEGQGFLRYKVADVKHITNFMSKSLKFGLDLSWGNRVMQVA
jgi:hypothetical protein